MLIGWWISNKMPKVQGGKLDKRFTIQTSQWETTDDGGTERVWTATYTRWGSLTAASGTEGTTGDRRQAETSHIIKMRQIDLTPDQRLVYNGRVFEIVSVLGLERRDYITTLTVRELTGVSATEAEAATPEYVAVFDGSNYLQDGLSIPAWQVTSTKFSITGAFNATSIADSFIVTNFGGSASSRAYYIRLRADGTILVQTFGPSSPAVMGQVTSEAISVGQWVRWVVYIDQDESEVGISVNGSEYVTDALLGPIRDSASNFVVGSLYGSSNFFIGKQSGIGVYKDQVLTVAQSAALYNDGVLPDVDSLASLDEDMSGYTEWLQLSEADAVFYKTVDELAVSNVNSVGVEAYE